jgi:uncharacterized membrane protein YvbJ
MTTCPLCGGQTFRGAIKCDACGKPLTVRCGYAYCGEPQYFENTRCTVCGKPIKDAKKRLLKESKGKK